MPRKAMDHAAVHERLHRGVVRAKQQLVEAWDKTVLAPGASATPAMLASREFWFVKPEVEAARAWLKARGEPEHPPPRPPRAHVD